jgi:hypothetical protein
MNYSQWMFEERYRRILALGTYVLIGLTAIIALGWTVLGSLAGSKAKQLETGIKGKQAALIKARQDLNQAFEAAPVVKQAPVYDVIASFQSEVTKAGQSSGCVVTDFTPSSVPADFANRYSDAGKGAGYKQIHVEMVVNGDLSSVVTMLQQLANCGVVFQYDSLEMAPGAPDPKTITAKQLVAAKVALDVLTKPEAT